MSDEHPGFTDSPAPVEGGTFDGGTPPPPPSNRKLWLLLGCLPLTVILICCGGCGGILWWGLSALKSSEPFTESLRRARSNPAVVEALGEPINDGWMMQGSINLNNDDGDVDLNYPISGPRGEATVHVRGEKSDGVWDYDRMEVTFPDREPVDLLE